MAKEKKTAGKTAPKSVDNGAKFAAAFANIKTEAEGRAALNYLINGFTEAFNAKFPAKTEKGAKKAAAKKETKKAAAEVPQVAEGDKKALKKLALQFHDYSEKAFAITGDTKPVKDICNRYHGRFNRWLSCGEGWIFSKRYEADVRAALAI